MAFDIPVFARKFRIARRLARAGMQQRLAAPILCASIGRVGSWTVYEAVVRARAEAIFGSAGIPFRKPIELKAWDLANAQFQPCAVYKTHDFPYAPAAPSTLKVIFLYGRPSDIILSLVRCHETRGADWVEQHFLYMHADGSYEEMLRRDVLRLGEQIDAWRQTRALNVLGIRYETLWNNVDLVRGFLDLQFELPAKATRQYVDLDPEIVSIVRAQYSALDEKVAGLPDYFRSSPK